MRKYIKKAKLIRKVSEVLVALAAIVLASCAFDGQGGNLTINLPPISSQARAIASDKIGDLKNAMASYRVTLEANGQRTEKSGKGGNYYFSVPVGMVAQITVECLNKSGEVIVRAKKTHTVTAGVNNVDIKLSRDGDEIAPSLLKMISLTGGTFTMGNDSATDDNEKPAHQVTLTAFSISETEITQAQWKEVMENDGNGTDKPSDTYGKGDNFPMNFVSWYDAIVFCNKLSEKEGKMPCYKKDGSTDVRTWGAIPTSSNSAWNAITCDFSAGGYRLPTEAEWEYAARGGNKSNGYTYSGSNTIGDVAWYTVNSYDKGSSSPDYGTHQVATKKSNELGLYDMSGNVWEWCWDWYSNSYSTNKATDSTGAASGSSRVIRGGAWANDASGCTVSVRPTNDNDSPGRRWHSIGFRVVCRP